RVLDDHEIAAVWHAAERQGHPHGTLVQFLLLTGLRVTEAAELHRREVVNGVIRLPAERMKAKEAFSLPLSKHALDLPASCPADSEWYFPGERTGTPFTSYTKAKKHLDAMLNIEHWTLHDCRRTASTLMERAGVEPHVIDRATAHKVPGK